MSKNAPKLPTLGQPVFVISENPLEERVTVVGERGLLNNLVYFAVDSIKANKLEYADDTMKKIIINRDMVTNDEEKKSLELHVDLEKNSNREPDLSTVFFDEIDAQLIARKANENQKKSCRKLLDLATKAFNEYDTIIGLCSVK